MALSRIDKDHLDTIIAIPNLQELERGKIIEAIKRNSNNYAKLKILFKQLESIKNEINEVINESIEADNLQNIDCSFKKIPGNTYHLYKKSDDNLVFSMLHPKEWNTTSTYIGSYFYDFDLTFRKI